MNHNLLRHLLLMLALCMFSPATMLAEGTDYSKEKNIVLNEPVFATVRLTGIDAMPTSKKDNLHAWLTFDDGAGNTFTKRVILNAQGNSSLMFDKKNIAITLCEDEWQGDKTTNVTFGDWVKQDEFHLKAYYTDAYRGAGVAAYHLYDDIVATLPADSNRPWKRAGLTGDDNQRCHPDGFPCVVYLNDEFYGVYAWQLKKHRKNMNMTKTEAKHIHLDGTLWEFSIFNGEISWNEFEIRNPKTLYCMDGSVYDGDNPAELIDESSAAFSLDTDDETVKSEKQMTAKVKASIISLSKAMRAVKLVGKTQDKRAKIIENFDVTSLIDYYIFSLVTNNYDGFIKNWQWITYDGKRWSVEPYDLDGTFGQMFTGEFMLPPEWGFADDDFTFMNEYAYFGPVKYIVNYFRTELQQRYAELRDKGVISVDKIHSHVSNWVARIPSEYMQQEWTRWPECNCNNPSIPNEGWHQVHDFTNWIDLPDYSDETQYPAGSRITINHYQNMSVWEADRDICGVFPYQQVGYRTSLNELKDWLTKKLELVDNYLKYDSGSGIDQTRHDTPSATPSAIYSVTGIRQNGMGRGINIVRYNDGTVKKYTHE